MAAKFVWYGPWKDVHSWTTSYFQCQHAKEHQHTKVPFVVPERHFDHMHVDLVGPLPLSLGFTHLLTVMDRSTWWPEAFAIYHQGRHGQAFTGGSVSRSGVLSDVSLDYGAQFISELWAAVAQIFGVSLHRITTYHLQANGLCKCFHCSLEAPLWASLKDSGWVDRLP